MPPMRRTLMLAAGGTAAGALSGLFGVGGGVVLVPLFILAFGFETREATGTSLAAIIVIAAVAGTIQAIYGNVRLADALLVGFPAVGGVLLGTALQQRIPTRRLSGLLAALFVAVAVSLVI
jgi:uncharacterized membrane protein YfcA